MAGVHGPLQGPGSFQNLLCFLVLSKPYFYAFPYKMGCKKKIVNQNLRRGGGGGGGRLLHPPPPPSKSATVFIFSALHFVGVFFFCIMHLFSSLQLQSDLKTPLWSLSGNMGNSWYGGQVTVSSTIPYHLVFEAVVGGGELGDIAIDDVDYRDGACDNSGKI